MREIVLKNFIQFILIFILCACNKKFVANAPSEFYNSLESINATSTINIIANIPVKELSKTINSKIPKLLFEDTTFNEDNFKVQVNRKGDIEIVPNGDLLYFKVPLEIKAQSLLKLGMLSSVYDSKFELKIGYKSKVSAAPNWNIITTTTSNGFEWISQPKLKIGPLELNISPFVEKEVVEKQKSFASELDKIVSEKFSLKEYVQQSWALLQTPVAIPNTNNGWVKISPKNVAFIPPFGDSLNLKTGVKLVATTETFFGKKPTVIYSSLPLLQLAKTVSDSFHVNLSAQLSFDFASQLAKQHLKDKIFTFQDGKKSIRVTDVHIYGSGDKVIAKTVLEGDFEGTVYLAGKPQYDSSLSCIKILDMDFSLDSKNKLLKAASWIAHGSIIKKMEKEFRFSVKDQIDGVKSEINKNIASAKLNSFITLNGVIKEVKPQKLFVVEDYFLLLINGKGNLSVNVSSF